MYTHAHTVSYFLSLANHVPSPFLESNANRRAWLTCLEFSHTHTLGVSSLDDYDSLYVSVGSTVDEEDDQLWSRVHTRLVPSPRLTSLIRGQALDVLAMAGPTEQLGIPHSLRPHIWPRLTGSWEKAKNGKLRNPPITYTELVQLSSCDNLGPGIQIEKDLLRTMPSNLCFSSSNSTGISRLRRVLRALAWLYVDVGYCQGMGLIAANLLLCLEEETTFWMMCSIIEDLLPPSYYSSVSLLGVQADQAVLCHLLPFYLPEVDHLLKENEIASFVEYRYLPWLAVFCEPNMESELLSLHNTSQIFNTLSNAPGSITDVNELIRVAYTLDEEHLEPSNLSSLRRHHLAQLMVEENVTLRPDSRPNLPKQYLAKRQLKPPRSLFSTLLHSMTWSPGHPHRRITGMAVPFRDPQSRQWSEYAMGCAMTDDTGAYEDPKLKNVRQTELLVDLKQAILMASLSCLAVFLPWLPQPNCLRMPFCHITSTVLHWRDQYLGNWTYPSDGVIVRHFRQCDPQHADATSQADYSMESHGLDLETYVRVAQHRRRRAKALIDFERQEPDELAFRKNDILTVLNSDDEHCWIGELDNARGWFPAKFVELLDERGKNYSAAGDDGVNQNIASLVRGNLCSALGAVFTYGLKRPRLLGDSGCHPWHFIEEAAAKEVERDFASVYSRLVLCKTFRLDEEGKVLSPEEVLYRAVHSINMSHDLVHAHMDVKFRSLVCYGLNEQLLHMWLETLCSSVKVVEKWYYPWSYMRSPGWVQIKCELRILSQFAFHLSPVYELSVSDVSFNAVGEVTKTLHPRRTRSIGNSNGLPEVLNNKPLRRLTQAASIADPINDPPSLALSFTIPLPDSTEDGSTSNVDDRLGGTETGDMLIKYHLFSWEL
ncbi:small G protein signaling modulator 3 [Paragonimus westermani]|uniref:RUN and TBC1 domain-containing protein 3 n=1 Tax=Paragonimus westermani TaxID=34504 RepID=A0A5J4NWR0_9TREM|nr:small G protein signaling modulator 3 [Paragonimus westermani]